MLFVLKGHTDGVKSAAFSPDGSRVLTVSDDKTARVWDSRTGRPLLEFTGDKDVMTDAAFSLDGSRVVIASQNRGVKLANRVRSVRMWDTSSGREVTGEPLPTLARPDGRSPDGRLFAHADSDRVPPPDRHRLR